MENVTWNSSPGFIGEEKWRRVAAAFFCFGLIILLLSFYVLATEVLFFEKGTALEATIVEAEYGWVPAGRGSVMAYVPVVEIPQTGERIRVETSSQENIYRLGSQMSVLCDPVAKRCLRHAFFDEWWGLVDLLIALLFLVPSGVYLGRLKRQSARGVNEQHDSTLNVH